MTDTVFATVEDTFAHDAPEVLTPLSPAAGELAAVRCVDVARTS
jgi:hypothetical protein